MRWGLVVLGVLMVLTGGVWLLQGIGILPGSIMRGQSFWAWVGGGVLLAGVAVLIFGLRRGAASPRL